MAGTIDERREDGSEASKKMSLEKEGGMIRMLWGLGDPEERDPEERARSARGGGGGRVQDSASVTDDIRAPCGGSAQQAADRATRGEGGQGDQVHPLSTFS